MKLSENKMFVHIIDYLLVIVGTAIMAMAMDVFIIPNHVISGGVNGIAVIINFLCGFPVGICSLLFNIPLLILGLFFLGKQFLIKTLISSVTFTLFTDFVFNYFPQYTHDMLLASIFGGVLTGIGIGIIYLRGGSSGGTDITSRLLQKKYPQLKMGALGMATNFFIILAAVICFQNIESALYAIVIIFIQSQIIDKFLYGLDTSKMIMVITDKKDAICEAIMVSMKHGCTIIPAKGAYSGDQRNIILCAIYKNEFYRLKKLVYAIDKKAFVIVTDAGEVVGKGFASESLIPKELQE